MLSAHDHRASLLSANLSSAPRHGIRRLNTFTSRDGVHLDSDAGFPVLLAPSSPPLTGCASLPNEHDPTGRNLPSGRFVATLSEASGFGQGGSRGGLGGREEGQKDEEGDRPAGSNEPAAWKAGEFLPLVPSYRACPEAFPRSRRLDLASIGNSFRSYDPLGER